MGRTEPLAEVPAVPDWYGEYQKQFFVETCAALVDAKQLRAVDVPSVELAAYWYSLARRAMDAIETEGYAQASRHGNWQQTNAHLKTLNKATRVLQSFSDRYGLSLRAAQAIPKARTDKNSLSDMLKA